jgi:hypothetical protein
MMNNGTELGLQTISLRRRGDERFSVGGLPFNATWLSEQQKVNGAGVLLNISSGGFAGRMVEAPVVGRLLHTKMVLPMVSGERRERSVEADARVCGRVPVSDGGSQEWFVHFAIESIHPVDEKHMATALQVLKRRMS